MLHHGVEKNVNFTQICSYNRLLIILRENVQVHL